MSASSTTPKLGLPQWGSEDDFNLADFNDAFSKIDAVCAIKTGSYTGTGEAGQSHPCTLELGFSPKLVIVIRGTTLQAPYQAGDTSGVWPPDFVMFLPGPSQTVVYGTYSSGGTTWRQGYMVSYSFGGTSISWYAMNVPEPNYAEYRAYTEAQMNLGTAMYHYLAIG